MKIQNSTATFEKQVCIENNEKEIQHFIFYLQNKINFKILYIPRQATGKKFLLASKHIH